jgi:hypothetical protein
MDLKKLYDCLSLDEKKELRGYLNDEFISNNDLYSVEWCIRFHPSVRLRNILCNNFKNRRVLNIKKKNLCCLLLPVTNPGKSLLSLEVKY